MPYTSDAQRRWAHTDAGTKALGGPAKVAEWDRASKGKDLPMKAGWKGGGPVSAKYAQGGPVLQPSKSRFLKTPDVFRGEGNARADDYGQNYGKSGKGGKMSQLEGDDKSLKPIKPRT